MSSQPSLVSTLEALIAARDLISDPKRWTQDVQARDKYGHRVGALHPSAAKWCAMGAIRRVGDPLPTRALTDSLMRASMTLFDTAPVNVNDLGHRSEAHARVLAMFDHAISTLELHGGNR